MAPRSLEEATQLVLDRVLATAAEPEPGFPVNADPQTGEWSRRADGFWTGGFWAGLLWLVGEASDPHRQPADALVWARRLRARARSDTVLRGLLFWYGAGLGAALTDDAEAAELALAGARGLEASFVPAAGIIPQGLAFARAQPPGQIETNIDGVAGTMALLAWATEASGDRRFAEIAEQHGRRHVEACIRADGSVCQAAMLDESTGAVLGRHAQKGWADESTWARGQAWAMLGFAQAARRLSDDFLPAVRDTCDWWITHQSSDRVARWDFDDPAGEQATPDTSATAIAASALLKAAALLPERATRYRSVAAGMTEELVNGHLTPLGPSETRPSGMLVDGCYWKQAHWAIADELIWGDYFLLETLLVLTGRLDPLVT